MGNTILAVCPHCSQDNQHLLSDRPVLERAIDSVPVACCSCCQPFIAIIKSEREVKADMKQREFLEKYGMLGMCMNPYEPFDVRIVDKEEYVKILTDREEP